MVDSNRVKTDFCSCRGLETVLSAKMANKKIVLEISASHLQSKNSTFDLMQARS